MPPLLINMGCAGGYQFNKFQFVEDLTMGKEEVVYNAFQVLSDGGVIIEPIGELPWSKCCATIIDKYGVCWWISI